VPIYHEAHDIGVHLSDFFLHDGSICYELGCSTAVLTRRLAERNSHKDLQIIGIDSEKPMVEKAREYCSEFPNVTILQEDIIEIDLEPADMILAYYTMQFIQPKSRQLVFDKLYNSLNWGGALVLFEKVRAPDARFQDIATSMYTEYKISQGYNEEEIVGKTRSLKSVLEPFSTQGNLDLMTRSGFTDIMTISKYICFEGFLAIK
jgi:tRNA (cmo5U34)-methyltransferase